MPAQPTPAPLVPADGESSRPSWLTGVSPAALGVSTLTLGAGLAQGVQFVGSLFLARLYSPTDFGVFAACLSVATVLATIGTMQYPVAIPLAETDGEARQLNWLSIGLAGVICIAVGAILFLVNAQFGGDEGLAGLGPSLLWVAPMAWLVAVWTSLRSLQGRLGGFTAVSVAGALGSLSQVALQMVLGLVGSLTQGLTIGYTMGRAVNVLGMLRPGVMGTPPRVRAAFQMARHWRHMPQWVLLPSFLNTLSISAAAGLVAILYGVEVAGYFALAMSMLAVPATLIGQAVATVIHPHAARLDRNNESAAEPLERAVQGLFALGLPFFGLVAVAGPQFFALLFGEQWYEAGVVAALISPWLLASLVSSPISGFAFVRNRERVIFVIAIVEAVLRLGALSLGVTMDSWTVGIAAYGLTGFVISVAAAAWFLHLAGSSLPRLVIRFRVPLIAVLGLYAALFVAGEFLPDPLFLALAIGVTAVIGLASLRHAAVLTGVARSAGG